MSAASDHPAITPAYVANWFLRSRGKNRKHATPLATSKNVVSIARLVNDTKYQLTTAHDPLEMAKLEVFGGHFTETMHLVRKLLRSAKSLKRVSIDSFGENDTFIIKIDQLTTLLKEDWIDTGLASPNSIRKLWHQNAFNIYPYVIAAWKEVGVVSVKINKNNPTMRVLHEALLAIHGDDPRQGITLGSIEQALRNYALPNDATNSGRAP